MRALIDHGLCRSTARNARLFKVSSSRRTFVAFARVRRGVLFFSGAATKAWTALVERRLPFSPVWWAKALALHWQEIRLANLRVDGPQAMDRDRLEKSYLHW